MYHKKKWAIQRRQRREERTKRRRTDEADSSAGGGGLVRHGGSGIGDFLRKTARSMFDLPWQIVQVGAADCNL